MQNVIQSDILQLISDKTEMIMNRMGKLPSPRELARKSSTKSISLRVNENTLLAFEKYAKLYDTTTSALINNLLDAYVEQLGMSDTDAQLAASRIMRSKLFNKAMTIKNKSYEEASLMLAGITDSRDLQYRYQEILATTERLFQVFTFDGDKIAFCVEGANCIVKDCEVIEINKAIWPHAAIMLITYYETIKNLCGENETRSNITLFPDTLQGVKAILATMNDKPRLVVEELSETLYRGFCQVIRAGNLTIKNN